MESQKERLEKELLFLEESLEAEVITREEYDKGKKRIEDKLSSLEEEPEGKAETEDIMVKELKEFPEEPEAEEPEEYPSAAEEEKEEISLPEEEPKEEEFEETEEPEEKKVKPAKVAEKKPKKEKPEQKKSAKSYKQLIRTAAAIAIVLIIALFLFKMCSKAPAAPICSSDIDCKEPGKIGECLNASTKEAQCIFYEPVPVNLTILNDKACLFCDTNRMLSTITQLFPGVTEKEIDVKTPEGNTLLNKMGITALPAYIFGANIENTVNFDNFKRALVKKGDKYIINLKASGSDYFFKRAEQPNKLELFLLKGSNNSMVESKIQEALGLFGDKITFNKKIISEEEKTDLEKELGITSYPAFLVNNQIKFTGTLSSDQIKENFCVLNKLKECEKKLSTNL